MKSIKPKWTDEQKEVIKARGAEILVSAAAGSGKTDVLVERIYDRIMDVADPVDIDRFVVVTFTKAAAAEMKERLRKRIEDALSDEKLNPSQKDRLRRQIRLIPGAHISTVHSFCNYIIGQYFYRIGLDPAFKEAEESEIKLIKNQVLDSVLESEYEKDDESFERIASLRSLNKNDKLIKEWIIKMYENAYSEPFPDQTLDEWEAQLRMPLTDERSKAIPMLIGYVSRIAQGIKENTQRVYDINSKGLTGKKDADTFSAIADTCRSLITIGESFDNGERTAGKAYEDMKLILEDMNTSGLPRSVTKKEGAEMRDAAITAIKPIRKKLEETLRDGLFKNTIDEHEKEREVMAVTTCELIDLTRKFSEEFANEKRERGIVDFNDLEQFALKILFDTDEKGRKVKSEAAKELSEYFCEVMIDEYQDSNRVQDTILWSISKSDGSEDDGKSPWECTAKNRFMVGDIKQSIYRFRHACPDLFRHKLNTYSHDKDAKCRRIDLHKNFRSDQTIINSTNEVFDRIMKPDIGGVDYDEDARLVYGLKKPEPDEGTPVARVVYDDVIYSEVNDDRFEAMYIAARIKDMVKGDDPLYIVGEDNKYRRVRYGDIVILSRAVMPIAYEYTRTFRSEGVPFVTELTNGFFDAREVSLVIQLLQIIDNPRQDIPLAGVLASGMFGLDDEMLSKIRVIYPYVDFYEAITLYAKAENPDTKYDQKIVNRLNIFLEMLDEFRKKAPFVSMTSLVEDVYKKTNIYGFFDEYMDNDYVRRRANLDYLLHMVTEFDKTSKQGVHAFVDYIRLVRESDADVGEAAIEGDGEDVVKLMSIHKSKGLEFPVVFITRAGSEGARMDAGRFVYDMDLGVGGLYDDKEYGWTKRTLFWNMIHAKNEEDERGELFRLLYVAMTRAKEQLIVVHTEKKEKDYIGTSYEDRMGMKSLSDMMRAAIMSDVKHAFFETREFKDGIIEYWGDVLDRIPKESSVSDRDTNIFDTYDGYNDEVWGEEERKKELLPVRVSVSELKKASMEESFSHPQIVYKPPETEDLPRFMRRSEKKVITGAMKGTIYHQVMATIDFCSVDPDDIDKSIEAAIEKLTEDKHVKKDDASVIDPSKIAAFFKTDLAKRMIAAAGSGKLKRENPFVFNKPASSISSDYTDFGDTPVMVQGIIDGFFEEDDGIVLMDYKTDRIESDDPDVELADRYRVQMELYKDALEKLLYKNVKECYLYSFYLDREIKVEF